MSFDDNKERVIQEYVPGKTGDVGTFNRQSEP